MSRRTPDRDSILASAYALAEQQFGTAARGQLLDLGVTAGAISHQVRIGMWSLAFPGVYDLHASVRDAGLPWDARLMAVQLAHPGQAVGVGTTAGRIWDLPYCLDRTIHVAMRPGLEQEQRPDVRFHTWQVQARDVGVRGPFLVTSALRTTADLLLMRSRHQAVAILDAALHLGYIDASTGPRLIGGIIAGRRGCRPARTYLAEMAVGAHSPLETRIRLIASDAGLAPDALQVPITDACGQVVAYGDIGWRTRRGWLIAECDGAAVHSLPKALLHDRRRQNEILLQPGFEVVRFTWSDSRTPGYVISVLRRALRR